MRTETYGERRCLNTIMNALIAKLDMKKSVAFMTQNQGMSAISAATLLFEFTTLLASSLKEAVFTQLVISCS